VAPDVVLDHETGLLVPLADSASMAHAVSNCSTIPRLPNVSVAGPRADGWQLVEAMLDNIARVYDEKAAA
jgi:hypothetical protein